MISSSTSELTCWEPSAQREDMKERTCIEKELCVSLIFMIGSVSRDERNFSCSY